MLMIQSIYAMTLLLYSGTVQMLKWLVILEMLSWWFAFMMEKNSLGYLMVQSFFVPLALMGVLTKNLILILISMAFKMGLPPFHIWLFKIIQSFNNKIFIFFNTLHKLAPLLTLALFLYKNTLKISMVLSILSVSFLATVSLMSNMIIISSFFHSGWMLLANLKSSSLVLSYWALYSMVLVMTIMSLWNKDMVLLTFSISSITMVLLMILSGMPPLSIFWWKVSVVEFTMLFSSYMALAMLLLSVIAMWVYLRVIFFSLNLSVSSSGIPLNLILISMLGFFY